MFISRLCKEVVENATPHLQVFFIFKTTKQLAAVE